MSYKPETQVAPLGPHKAYPLSAASANEQAIGALLDATATAVGAAGSATITLTLVEGDIGAIRVGEYLDCDTGASYERVQVSAVDIPAKQVTATFANTHSAGFAVRLTHGAFVGVVAVPQVGTGVTLSLYDGHPNRAGSRLIYQWVTASGVLPALPLNGVCDQGLYVVYNGTTAGFVTITALAMLR